MDFDSWDKRTHAESINVITQNVEKKKKFIFLSYSFSCIINNLPKAAQVFIFNLLHYRCKEIRDAMVILYIIRLVYNVH